jgi:hypothetical protein
MQTAQMADTNPAAIFPSAVNFPNLVAHLRGGLPYRMDFAIRAANMTSPPGYKISAKTTAKAQSNSIGFTLRKHVLGGDDPLVSLGANFNHVYGQFDFNTKFTVDPTQAQGFTAGIPIAGLIQWNVNSFGLNAVVSQKYGRWTPFVGVGYNYLTGSLRVHLEADPQTDLLSPIKGESSDHPEQNQARMIFGTEMDRSWVNLFFNGEIQAIGNGSGRSYIVHAGMALPFHIGTGSGSSYASSTPIRGRDEELRDAPREASSPIFHRSPKPERRVVYPAAQPLPTRREMFHGTPSATPDASPTLIFIQ